MMHAQESALQKRLPFSFHIFHIFLPPPVLSPSAPHAHPQTPRYGRILQSNQAQRQQHVCSWPRRQNAWTDRRDPSRPLPAGYWLCRTKLVTRTEQRANIPSHGLPPFFPLRRCPCSHFFSIAQRIAGNAVKSSINEETETPLKMQGRAWEKGNDVCFSSLFIPFSELLSMALACLRAID